MNLLRNCLRGHDGHGFAAHECLINKSRFFVIILARKVAAWRVNMKIHCQKHPKATAVHRPGVPTLATENLAELPLKGPDLTKFRGQMILTILASQWKLGTTKIVKGKTKYNAIMRLRRLAHQTGEARHLIFQKLIRQEVILSSGETLRSCCKFLQMTVLSHFLNAFGMFEKAILTSNYHSSASMAS